MFAHTPDDAMPFRPYRMYHPVQEIARGETHGQSWKGQDIEEAIDLCRHQMLERLLLEFLPPHGKVLEAGCGTGRWVFYLLKKGYDIVGVDLAQEALEIAKAYDPSAPLVHGDVCRLEFESETFDAVMSLGVVEHFEEGPQKVLKELRRILSDDGILILTIPVQNILRRLLINRLKTFKRVLQQWRGVRYGFEEYRFTRGQMETLLASAGFVVERTDPDDFYPPFNMGLYVDLPMLRSPERRWELNAAGRVLQRLLNILSPWIASSGAIFVCRKRTRQNDES